jgi:predicted phosphodiesterase
MASRYYGRDLIDRFANDRHWKSTADFAKFLNEIEPNRSVDAWRVAILRWTREGNSFRDFESVEDSTTTSTKTYYDSNNDKYIVMMEAVDGLIVIDGDKHRAMKQAYSDVGGGLTVDDMAREFDMPAAMISEYIKVNKWKHGMQPFTDEEIKANTLDDMVENFLDIRKLEIMKKAERKKWKNIEKDAAQYTLLRSTLADDFLEILKDHKPASVKSRKMKVDKKYAVVLSPTDLHFGKYGWVDEVGETYDLDEARARVLDKTEELLARLPSKPDKFYVGVGSDWFHVDNDIGTTTKGTTQDMAGSPAQILMQGCDLARQHIDLLRTVSEVELVFMGGNHDRHTSIMLMLYLEAYYKDCKDVIVTVSPHIRQYVTYGNNLIGFTHGDGKVMNKLSTLMAHEARKDWGKTVNHLWFHGHLHHQQMREMGGCLVVQLPSLAGEDRYHSRNGYSMARAGLSAYMIDEEKGLIGSLFAPVVHDD